MNHIKLLFFATIRDRAGVKTLELDIPVDLTIQGLAMLWDRAHIDS